MRITMNTIYSGIQTSLNKLTDDINTTTNQISSGLQMTTIADNPVNMVSALGYRSSIADLNQYTTNIQSGNAIITATQSALTQMKDLTVQAKTLAIQATDPANTSGNLASIATQVNNLLEQAVSLANTQIGGKYIFGGYKTTGYTAQEPTPFIAGKSDGYWVNGTAPAPLPAALTGKTINTATSLLAAVPPVTGLAAKDLSINGEDVGAVDLTTGGDTNGVNMTGAANLTGAINLHADLYANKAATADTLDGVDSKFSFTLNGTPINVTVPDGSSATAVSNTAINAINLQTPKTGVTAVLGNGTNGGPIDSVVFENAQPGDTSAITVANFTTNQNGGADLGFGNFSQKIVNATLTTQIAGAASAGAAGGEAINFTVNGVQVAYTATAGGTTAAAQQAVDAINAVQDKTGVTAALGTGANGGPADSVVLRNTLSGDDSAITLVGLTAPMTTVTGLGDPLSQGADATHNTGQISLSSGDAIGITTSGATGDPATASDTILNRIGLGGGSMGNYDAAGDGQLVYGYPLSTGDLTINGIAAPVPTDDGLSDLYADASAAAKAAAINGISTQTGVTAVVSPAVAEASGPVTGGTETEWLTGTVTNSTIPAGSLAINGTNIGAINADPGDPNFGLNTGTALNAQLAINSQTTTTGVSASLTTLYAGGVATAGNTQALNFDLNNVPVSVITGGTSATATTTDIVKAINAVSQQSGVQAVVGDGTNGGAVNSIVLSNVIPGDETNIKVTNLNAVGVALSGLTNGTYSIDATHNTGQISLESDSSFTITSPTSPSDLYLRKLGLNSDNNSGTITYGSTPNLKNGDLTINGTPIITGPITDQDANNTLLDAINDQTGRTGVKATRDQSGTIQLSAVDGRNIHVETSANGEAITHLTGGSMDKVAFGSLQLNSDQQFSLQTVDPSVNLGEPGLAALGLTGGASVTGETGDVAGDGRLDVSTIHDQTGSVRYTGDRTNDQEIAIGNKSTMTVATNGQTGIMDTDIFSTLNSLKDYLNGVNFTTVTGTPQATNTTVPLNSKATGLEPDSLEPTEDLFSKGTFTVTVTDHDYDPPRDTSMTIGVDPAVDTLNSVSQRINGIPNISASWTADGQLNIASSDPNRYTISLGNDNSNFLEATGVSSEFMQSQGLQQSLAALDTVANNLSSQVSDSGARANRIDVQSQIYSDMTIATQTNLSTAQDTDMVQATMDLSTKQVAYQAALAAAAKVMQQLSLVDYLK
jgi:flagellin-like hook-associated protein FlgL